MNQPTERAQKYRATWIGMVVNVLSLLKLATSILGRSGAMIADAVHSISDLATDVIVLIFADILQTRRRRPQLRTRRVQVHLHPHGLALIAVGGGIVLADGVAGNIVWY